MLNRAPEERPAAGARAAAVVDVLAGLIATDGAQEEGKGKVFWLFGLDHDRVILEEVFEGWGFDLGYDRVSIRRHR